MKVSVIIPVYNERETVIKLIEKVKSVLFSKEIIVVDDGSTDGTIEELDKIEGVSIFNHPKNEGKGKAIRTGLKYARGDVVIFQDADLEYDPIDYQKLLNPIAEGRAEAVYGSRFKGGGEFTGLSLMANRVLTWITNFLYGSRLTDMETCYKCIKRDVINSLDLRAKRFEIEPEVTAKLILTGHKVVEVPITYKGRTKFKKIGAKDGVQAILTLIKWRVKWRSFAP